APLEEVVVLSRFAAPPAPTQTTPQHAKLDAELAGEGGQYRGVTKRVGRVQDVQPSPQTLGIGRAEQQVPDEGLTGWNQLVGEDVPGTDLQAPGLHQPLDLVVALGARPQIVLDQNRLPIEQEAAKSAVRLQPFQQGVEQCHEPRVERGPWEVPLAIPVGVRDQMEDVRRHGSSVEISARLDRCTCATRRPRPRSARISPRACAACSAPNVNPMSGMGMSSVVSTVITRKRPEFGPPLCS